MRMRACFVKDNTVRFIFILTDELCN